jgi:hypothetical protein
VMVKIAEPRLSSRFVLRGRGDRKNGRSRKQGELRPLRNLNSPSSLWKRSCVASAWISPTRARREEREAKVVVSKYGAIQ